MSLIEQNGLVGLSPSRLQKLACPRGGREAVEKPDRTVSVHSAKGNCMHRVLEVLGRRQWPQDWFDQVPRLVTPILKSEWAKGRLDSAFFEDARATVTETLRDFLYANSIASAPGERSEPYAELTDPAGLVMRGQLDRLLPPSENNNHTIELIDWKGGRERLDEVIDPGNPPLWVAAQAALSRAVLKDRSHSVTVRYIYLQTCGETEWRVSHDQLVHAWHGIRVLADDIRNGRWRAVPGDWCRWCRDRECPLAPSACNIYEIGLDPNAA